MLEGSNHHSIRIENINIAGGGQAKVAELIQIMDRLVLNLPSVTDSINTKQCDDKLGPYTKILQLLREDLK